jgi:hypothetical protein
LEDVGYSLWTFPQRALFFEGKLFNM